MKKKTFLFLVQFCINCFYWTFVGNYKTAMKTCRFKVCICFFQVNEFVVKVVEDRLIDRRNCWITPFGWPFLFCQHGKLYFLHHIIFYLKQNPISSFNSICCRYRTKFVIFNTFIHIFHVLLLNNCKMSELRTTFSKQK